ncbi:MAG: hypothetical protein FWD57_08780 [Polyangiaceae bacterium]|nr:hypothetical protein [Polyangiaceae bacterium]
MRSPVANLGMNMTIDWNEVLRIIRDNPNTRWSVSAGEGFRREGRITHRPACPTSEWQGDQAIFVGDGYIGDRILVRLIDRIVQV